MQGARGVIINVTGGRDLSLIEVSEASSIIQEAAHEDANIIFGAVVDPSLSGKVKITVIATGFERTGTGRGIPAAAVQTPVDLHNYTAHLSRAAGGGGEQPVLELGSPAIRDSGQQPSLTVTRRAGVELTVPSVDTSEHSSPLHVPAFLRRQS